PRYPALPSFPPRRSSDLSSARRNGRGLFRLAPNHAGPDAPLARPATVLMVHNDFPTPDGPRPQRRNRCDVRTNSPAVAMADGTLSAEAHREPPIRRVPVLASSTPFDRRIQLRVRASE